MAIPMTQERWSYTKDYTNEVFGNEDKILNELMPAAIASGIPSIAVSADVGRLLTLLVKMTRAKCVVELGTLAGYSTLWMARAMPEDGHLYTVELEDAHADFAEEQFRKAKLDHKITVIRGAALEVLPALLKRCEHAIDFFFIDAVKTEYPAYFELAQDAIVPGGLFVADNIMGAGDWWIDDETHESRVATDALCRRVSNDERYDAAAVPLREGLMIARRR